MRFNTTVCVLFLIKFFFLPFQEKSATKKGTLHFIKVHVPWEVMLFYAEELNFKGPLKVIQQVQCNAIMKVVVSSKKLASTPSIILRHENTDLDYNYLFCK